MKESGSNINDGFLKNVLITSGDPALAEDYARFVQPVYETVYPNKKYRITAEHFKLENFLTDDTLSYCRKILTCSDSCASYLAFYLNQIVGGISVEKSDGFNEIKGFYVGLKFQGCGIGRILWQRAMQFCDSSMAIKVEVAENNFRAIQMYQRWGFREATELGINLRHWVEWPENDVNGYIYLIKEPD